MSPNSLIVRIVSIVCCVFSVFEVQSQEVTMAEYRFASNGDLYPQSGAIGNPSLSTSRNVGFSGWNGNPYSCLYAYDNHYVEVKISTIGYKNIRVEWQGYKPYSGVGQWNMSAGRSGVLLTQDCPLNTWGVASKVLNSTFDNSRNVKVRFTANLYNGRYVYLDNIKIKGTPIRPTISDFTPREACVGGQITITGSNFTGTNTVSINGMSASYSVDSDSQITATIPNGATTGLISVTTNNGTGQSSLPLTINNPPILTALITDDDCGPGDTGAIDLTVDSGITGSLDFSNTNKPVDLQSTFLSGLSQFTIEGWVKLDAPIASYDDYGTQHSFFGQNDVIEFGFENGAFTCWTAGGGNIQYSMINYPDDQDWHHVAAVGTGDNLMLYIDGEQKVTKTHTRVSSYGNDRNYTVKIGAGVWDGTITNDPLNGEVSVVRFWNVARTQNEIFDGRFQKMTGSETGLLAAYRLDEAVGTTISGVGSVAKDVTFTPDVTWQTYPSPYSYYWSTGSTNEDITGLSPGTYNVTVSKPGCNTNGTYVVGSVDRENPQVTCQANIAHVLYCDRNNVSIQVPSPSDDCSVQTLTYRIGSGSESANKISNVGNAERISLSQGDHTVTWTATDASGKSANCSFTIHVDGEPAINNISVTNTSCKTSSDGRIVVDDISVESGTVEYSINGGGNWQSLKTFTGLAAGDYNVMIRVGGSCSSQVRSVTVDKPVGFTVNATSDKSEICAGQTVRLSVSPDYSMNFDGNNDWLLIPNHSSINTSSVTERTVMLWFQPKDILGRQVLYEEGAETNGFSIFLQNGKIQAYGWVNNRSWSVAGGNVDKVNEWYHFTFTWKSGGTNKNFKAYLNGKLLEEVDAGASMPSHSGDNRIGNAGDIRLPNNGVGSGYYYKGKLDDFRMWNSVLSQAQIQSEMESVSAQSASPVVVLGFNDQAFPITNGGSTNNVNSNGGVSYVSDYSVLWNDPINSTSYSVDDTPAGNTSYSVTLTNDNGCQESGSVSVTVNPLPVPKGIIFE
eukprot:TRINITY_DN561_c1_g1_i1.p1 TRINITY_DN561_c1_g1~~TRINITY_DN561_c1_g1_i1.p1  ORF type:complete len:1015 (+),score=118.03 TRINITY_DN561_c1_g1_i1:260-3304(+)